MASARPRPVPDLDSAPWWEGLGRRELFVQHCDECDRLRWPPRALCNNCGSVDARWLPASGRGTVVSWTVTYRPFGPGVEVPFVTALIRLDDQDDIVIPGYVDGPADGGGLEIGMPVTVGFEEVDADGGRLVLLKWKR